MKSRRGSNGFHSRASLGVLTLGATLLATPASAHHAMGGATPSNGWEGLLSGLAHPVIGLDHLAFVIAAGLIASVHRRGAFIPIAFVAASLIGTGIHGLAWKLPGPELLVSFSVLLFGTLLMARHRSFPLSAGLAAGGGVFHGYAYGASIVGVASTPLVAYLLGLALVQLAIALSVQGAYQVAARRTSETTLRWAGFAICCVGLAYLSA
ncbi:MAG TPA: HupE/UreJ family protein [Vicinamibacteria bacterium]